MPRTGLRLAVECGPVPIQPCRAAISHCTAVAIPRRQIITFRHNTLEPVLHIRLGESLRQIFSSRMVVAHEHARVSVPGYFC